MAIPEAFGGPTPKPRDVGSFLEAAEFLDQDLQVNSSSERKEEDRIGPGLRPRRVFR
jgi:hypothetical protein